MDCQRRIYFVYGSLIMAVANLLDRLKRNYREKLEAGMMHIDVDELAEDGVPLRIYFKHMTLEKQGRVYKAMQSNNLDFMGTSLIERALDADGKPMLRPADIVEIRKRTDGNLIQDICARMSEEQSDCEIGSRDEVEEAEKN